MEKLKAFAKKYRVHLAIATFVLLFFVVVFSSNRSGGNTPAGIPTPTPLATEAKGDWGNAADLIAGLGEPINRPNSSNKTGEYDYKSDSVNRNHEVVYQNNTPLFYKEIVTSKDNKTSRSIRQKYGEPELKMYGAESSAGVDLYAYPSKGIAYLGSQFDDVLSEVWYFAPIDKGVFVAKWALQEGYTLTPQDPSF